MEAIVFFAYRGLAAFGGSQNSTLIPPSNLIPIADEALHLNGRLVALNDRTPVRFEEESSATDDSLWNGFLARRFMGRQWNAWAKSTSYASYCVVVLN